MPDEAILTFFGGAVRLLRYSRTPFVFRCDCDLVGGLRLEALQHQGQLWAGGEGLQL